MTYNVSSGTLSLYTTTPSNTCMQESGTYALVLDKLSYRPRRC